MPLRNNTWLQNCCFESAYLSNVTRVYRQCFHVFSLLALSVFLCRLSRCGVTDGGCSSLASALLSNPSHLREINLDNNNPGYSGLRLLSAVMEDPTFKLETLRLVLLKCSGPSFSKTFNPDHNDPVLSQSGFPIRFWKHTGRQYLDLMSYDIFL